jgi:inulin fructotransferase (DFA-I-forming)
LQNKGETVNDYSVQNWPIGDCFEDIGFVINSIISDIKARQAEKDNDGRGKPGAVIHIPPGDYKLRTPVLIDISFLRIEGNGHGFVSSSIRYNMSQTELDQAHELWPGGSRIMVEIPFSPQNPEPENAAFIIARQGTPRISSVEFANFCIDGLHFEEDGSGCLPENSYKNGKTGILIRDPNDSIAITGMGFVYLENALKIYYADALSIHSNFIAESGSCIELRGWGQASKITNNLIGAGPNGHGIYAENHGGLLVSSNNIFPRGASSITLLNVVRSNISANRLHAFYPGMLRIQGNSGENLISSNHLVRDHEPWLPFNGIHNDLHEDEALVIIEGQANTFTSNHISMVQHASMSEESEVRQTAIRVRNGALNFISTNNIVASKVKFQPSENCFDSQVESLTALGAEYTSVFTAVVVEGTSTNNTILDSGDDTQVVVDLEKNAFRPTPRTWAHR